MPTFKTKKKALKYAKKLLGSRRKSKKRNVKHAITRSLGKGFPDRLTMTHKYTEQSYFNPATGAYQYQTFSANDMYDPNVTGTGHQPLYFDQLAAIYNHYTVIGSKFKITFLPIGPDVADGNVPANVGVFLNDNSTIAQAGSYSTLSEFAINGGQTKWIPGGTNTVNKLFCKWSPKKKFGGSILANNALRGAANSSPTEQQYYSVWFYNAHSSSTATVLFVVDIEYIAVWSEVKDTIGGS